MCLLSVVVPVYNVEKYLAKCIESLLNQTLADIEIILVNDGSTDRSLEICQNYSNKDTRIKIINKLNGGLSDARNAGIDVAQGKYIGFIDSDDWVEREMYEYLFRIAENNKADIVQCEFVEAYDEDTLISSNIKEEIVTYDKIQALDLLHKKQNVKTIVVWNKIYKREIFNEIRFPKGRVHEDEFTTYKLLHKAKNIIDTNRIMVYYRQRPESITGSGFNVNRLQILEALEERENYFLENKLIELSKKTQATRCNILKNFYCKCHINNIENKKQTCKKIKKYIANNYLKFMSNKYISIKGKIMLNLALINREIFVNIYKKTIYK